MVNLGGTAIGTGLGAPRQYVFRVVEQLRQITGLGLARAENLVDATQNADVFAEVSGILRTLAANLLKISNDLRLLSSGPHAGLGEIHLPPRQAGSSIMPGKVNPVIPEAVAQAGHGGDGPRPGRSSRPCAAGNLELNQFLPLVADSLLASLDLLTAACDMFARLCVAGIEADRAAVPAQRAEQHGHAHRPDRADRLRGGRAPGRARRAAGGDPLQTIRRFVLEHGMLTAEEFDELTSPERVTRLGSNHAPPRGQGGAGEVGGGLP